MLGELVLARGGGRYVSGETAVMSGEERLPFDDLWRAFKARGDIGAREELIVNYLGLVETLSRKIRRRLPPQIMLDDISSYGVLGLIDAVERFDPNRGIRFEAYAKTRIRGAIFDGLRQLDWMPDALRRKDKDLEESWLKLTQHLGRVPSHHETANYMGISTDQLASLMQRTSMANPVSLEGFWPHSEGADDERRIGDSIADPNTPDPVTMVMSMTDEDMVAEALEQLSEKERFVIANRYYEGRTLKEVADILDLSTARISQIHTSALRRLRSHLNTECMEAVV